MKNYKPLLVEYTDAQKAFVPLQAAVDKLRQQATGQLCQYQEYGKLLKHQNKTVDNVLPLAVRDEGVRERDRATFEILSEQITAASTKAAAAAKEVQRIKLQLEDGLEAAIAEHTARLCKKWDLVVSQLSESLLPNCENAEEATELARSCTKIQQIHEAIYAPKRAYTLEGKIRALLAHSIAA